MDNRCVCCGEIIPEGRVVCVACENTDFSMSNNFKKDIRVCVRCDKRYVRENISQGDTKQSLLKMVNILKGKDKRITDFIDLCPDCVNSFRTWLKYKD